MLTIKLRPESTKEALNVKKVLKKFSIKADILTWKGKKSFSNIQSAARKKRFQLLFSKSDKFNINDILLGHHQDDLIENFFIRISRGSGLKGLISLSKKSKILNKNIHRPLLDQKKRIYSLLLIMFLIFTSLIHQMRMRNLKELELEK